MTCAVLPSRLAGACAAVKGRCVYVPELLCREQDRQALEQLARDIAAHSEVMVPHRTNKRLQVFGDALASSVLPSLVGSVLKSLKLVLIDCWVNVYRDGEETTGWHQDHYNLHSPNATATLNINLGATRDVALQCVSTGEKWTIAQRNGSLFAFDAAFNSAFKHSIPRAKLPTEPDSLRLSITIFAAEGAQPDQVKRDVDNVPAGVPLEVCSDEWQQHVWTPGDSLQEGVGAEQLLSSGALMRGHGKGKGKGKWGQRSGNGQKGKAAGRQVTLEELGAWSSGPGSPIEQSTRPKAEKKQRRKRGGGSRVQGAWAPPAPKLAGKRNDCNYHIVQDGHLCALCDVTTGTRCRALHLRGLVIFEALRTKPPQLPSVVVLSNP